MENGTCTDMLGSPYGSLVCDLPHGHQGKHLDRASGAEWWLDLPDVAPVWKAE